MKHGYVKVAAAVPFVRLGDCEYNIDRIEKLIREASEKEVEMLTFPELSITGYSCGDLFMQPYFLKAAEHAVCELARRTADTDVLIFVGMPIRVEERLYNAAIALQHGSILGAIPKTFLPNYREFQEKRWFSSSLELTFSRIRIGEFDVPIGHNLLFKYKDVGVGVEICEDMWSAVTPGTRLSLYGAHIIFNLSASNENAGKNAYLRSLISSLSAQGITGYVYASCGYGESSTDLVYTGKAFIAENGVILDEMPRFVYKERLLINDIDVSRIRTERLINTTFKSTASQYANDPMTEIPFYLKERSGDYRMTRKIAKNPFMPDDIDQRERAQEIWDIQMTALLQRLTYLNIDKVVVGVSGGLDSTLALLVAVRTFDELGLDRKGILAVTMPGPGTGQRTYGNASALMKLLGVTAIEIPISSASLDHLNSIGHDGVTKDVTYENAQARERTQILMDIANKENGFVLGTGDLSELALGWCTFNGDHMSMFNINGSVPKTVVRHIVTYVATAKIYGSEVKKILLDIVNTPVSPELTSTSEGAEQDTEKILGPYEVHDFILYHFLYNAFSPEKIFFMASKAFKGRYTKKELKAYMKIFVRRFFSQQFKRNCMPDGPKVGAVSLSPRGSWRMPSDMSAELWLKQIEKF